MPSEEQQHEQFIEKLGEIPLINDGWSTACGYYTRVKDYNSLTKFSLGVAENSVKKAAEISTPVLNRYQPQIETVNSFACTKLNDLENKYPLIKQPSVEVRDACIEYVQPYVGQVKPVVSYVNGMYETTQKRVECVKTTSTNLIVGAKASVNSAVTMTLESPPGRLVTSSLDWSLTQADDFIDRFIPEQPMEENDEEDDDDNEDTEDNGAVDTEKTVVEEMEKEPADAVRVVAHFKSVSSKLRRRLYQRALRDFRDAKVRTEEVLKNLNSTVDLFDYAKKNIDGARNKAQDIWEKIVSGADKDQSSDDSVSGSVLAGTIEERIVALGQLLTRQVRTSIPILEKAAQEAGLFVKEPITKSKEYADFLYQFGTDHMPTIESARATLITFQQRLQSLIDSIDIPVWLKFRRSEDQQPNPEEEK